jgi:hypothetical protein
MPFCTDTDMLYWEPNLFRDAATAAQLLLGGVASVAGAAVTFPSAVLVDAQVRPLQVIQFAGTSLSGAFPIISVDTDQTLTLSVVYDGLFPPDGTPGVPVHVGTAANQTFAIRTFFPQRQVVTQMLLQAAGLDPGAADAESRVVNVEAMRRPCVLGALQLVYSAMAASALQPAPFTSRADMYERLYRRALRSARVEVDTDDDGHADEVRPLNLLQLVRG